MVPDSTTGRPARRPPGCATAGLCCLLSLGTLPAAQAQVHAHDPATSAAAQTDAAQPSGSASRRQQAAVKRVDDAAGVAARMHLESGMADVLRRALGIYIVPAYGRAALGVGAAGGAGVLLVKRADGGWGNPAFFNLGGLSIGLQAGAEGGALALVLMNPKAVDSFRNKNNFSLSADAGLTVVNYARMARGSTGGDVVAWSGNKGLFGNVATVAITDVRYNPRLTDAYYGKAMTALQAIDSSEPNPQSDALRKVLAGQVSAPDATVR